MSNKKTPKQKTPKGHEIPIPTEGDFFGNLKKAAKPDPDKESASRRPKKDNRK